LTRDAYRDTLAAFSEFLGGKINAPMKRVRAIRILGLLAAAAFVGGLLVSERAVASCGDYVTVGGQAYEDYSHQAMHHEPASAPGAPKCSGPHCQRQAPPPQAPKHIVVFGPQELACWLLAGDSQTDELSKGVNEPSLLTSQATTLPFDRPPRASR
jgi:hypothetical protein